MELTSETVQYLSTRELGILLLIAEKEGKTNTALYRAAQAELKDREGS